MKMYVLAFSLLAIFCAETSLASPPDKASEVIRHLEFQGYDASVRNDVIVAKHPKNMNIFVKKYRGGMLATAFFSGSEYGKNNRSEWLPLVNKLNQNAAAVRYYIDDDGDRAIEAFYPGEYNRKSFSAFLDAVNLASSELADVLTELSKYLK